MTVDPMGLNKFSPSGPPSMNLYAYNRNNRAVGNVGSWKRALDHCLESSLNGEGALHGLVCRPRASRLL
jgi:hypothetical protein